MGRQAPGPSSEQRVENQDNHDWVGGRDEVGKGDEEPVHRLLDRPAREREQQVAERAVGQAGHDQPRANSPGRFEAVS